MPFDGAGTKAATGEQIDKISEALQDVVDPAKIPSALVGKTLTHLLTPLATTAFGPIGPVITIFIGNFASDFTHQLLDAGLDPTWIEYAESAIELSGAFADARIGCLAESQPFHDYVSSLIGKQIAAVISRDVSTAAGHKTERITSNAPTIMAVVAAYEVDASLSRCGSAASVHSRTLCMRPISFAVLECIPAENVVKRRRKGPHEFLFLADGTCLHRRIDGARPSQWSRISSLSRWLLLGE
jgi:hypothetical protein